jgi:hypothetical protein
MIRVRKIIYWVASIIAALLVLWVIWGYVYNVERHEPIIYFFPLVLAVVIWLVGRACRPPNSN